MATTKSKGKAKTRTCCVSKKKAKAPKKNNFQKWIAYMKKYPPGKMPSVDGSTILVTARRSGIALVPDRSFAELSDNYSKDIMPLLRVIDGGSTKYFPLDSFDGTEFVFEAALRIEEDPSSNVKTLITERYVYTVGAFTEDTRSFENTPVDITVEPLD